MNAHQWVVFSKNEMSLLNCFSFFEEKPCNYFWLPVELFIFKLLVSVVLVMFCLFFFFTNFFSKMAVQGVEGELNCILCFIFFVYTFVKQKLEFGHPRRFKNVETIVFLQRGKIIHVLFTKLILSTLLHPFVTLFWYVEY